MTRIAVVDGASGHIIDATISLEARGTPLNGAYITVQCDSDLMLGRITEVTMTNPVHSDDRFSPVIMKNGNVPFWSGEVDIERARIEIVGVLDLETKSRVPIRRNAPSGTPIMPADQSAINQFANEKINHVVLGHIPNSDGLSASIVNRHNGAACDKAGGDLGGYGEARHVAILGQSGSAKTVLLTTILAGRLAAHPQMGLLMPDTSGDLADPARHDRGDFRWNYAEALAMASVEIQRIAINDIRLTSASTLKYKLIDFFRRQLSITSEKAQTLSGRVVDALFGDNDVVASELTAERLIGEVITQIGDCYESKTRQSKVADAEHLRDTPHRLRAFDRELKYIRDLFDGRIPLWELVRDILKDGKKFVVEMTGANEADHRFIIREMMEKLTAQARRIFHTGKTANAIVVLDEAQRWVPEGDDDEEGVSDIIKAGLRETRKYGVGWFIVAQSPSGLAKKVLRECHTKWFGRNLGIGADRAHIEDILSKQGAEAYNQLQIQGGYFWVAVGLDSNLGTGATYFTLHPFGGNATQAFVEANPHIFGRTLHARAVAAE